MRLGHAAVIACVAVACTDDAVPRPAPVTLSRRGYVAVVASTGDVVDLRDAAGNTWMRQGDNLVRVAVGGAQAITCDAPTSVRREGDALTFEYDLRPRAPL